MRWARLVRSKTIIEHRPRKARFALETLEARALLSTTPVPSPAASFTWSMPNRFGLDQQTINYNPVTKVTTLTPGPDGIIDFNYSQSYVNPTSWALDLQAATPPTPGAVAPARVRDYTFTVDTKTYDNGRSPNLAAQVAQLGSHTVTLTETLLNGQKLSSTQTVYMRDYVIVSFGDSYASGQGNPDKPIVRGATGQVLSGPVWENAATDLSANAGPVQAALEIERSDPHSSVTFLSFAAAGATIDNGLIGPESGLPSQLDQLMATLYPNGTSPSANPRPIDALWISVGGDDINFTSIVEAGANPLPLPAYLNPKLQTQLVTDFAQLPGRYDMLASALQSNLGSLVHNVAITEYPDLTHNANGGFSAGSGLWFGISPSEFEFAYNGVIVPLNQVMQQAAARHGWTYVSGIASATTKHGLSAGSQSWFVTPGESVKNQGSILGAAHPNAQGQAVYRDRLVATFKSQVLS